MVIIGSGDGLADETHDLLLLFLVKLIFETVHGQQHSNSTHESVDFLKTENVSTWERLVHPIFEFMPNALYDWDIKS